MPFLINRFIFLYDLKHAAVAIINSVLRCSVYL